MFERFLIRVLVTKYRRELRLGYGAEFCRICRKIQPHEILEKRMAVHVCFIPVQRGQFLGNVKFCPGCQTETICYPEQFTSLSRSVRIPLESLIEKTNPGIRKANEEYLALAEQIATNSGTIDSTIRHRLIMEAFAMAEPHFRIGYGHQGRRILAVSLRPLAPKEEEVRTCLQRYRESGSRMGARLRTDDVMVSVYPETEVKDPNKFSY